MFLMDTRMFYSYVWPYWLRSSSEPQSVEFLILVSS